MKKKIKPFVISSLLAAKLNVFIKFHLNCKNSLFILIYLKNIIDLAQVVGLSRIISNRPKLVWTCFDHLSSFLALTQITKDDSSSGGHLKK